MVEEVQPEGPRSGEKKRVPVTILTGFLGSGMATMHGAR